MKLEGFSSSLLVQTIATKRNHPYLSDGGFSELFLKNSHDGQHTCL